MIGWQFILIFLVGWWVGVFVIAMLGKKPGEVDIAVTIVLLMLTALTYFYF